MLPVYTQVRKVIIECGNNYIMDSYFKPLMVKDISENILIPQEDVYNVIQGLLNNNLILFNSDINMIYGITPKGLEVYSACKDYYSWLGTQIKETDVNKCILHTCEYAGLYKKKKKDFEIYRR